LLDLEEGTTREFALADLPRHIDAFDFILGTQRRTFRNQSKASIEASELMGKLHDLLAATNYTGHNLERLLVRLLFCLFADDTGIFDKDAMLYAIEERTRADGTDLGDWIARLFQVLDTLEARRQTTIAEEWAGFPYVNGRLFAERIDMPAFDNAMRETLLDACRFDWGEVSPAIFGSLFQSVLSKAERRKKGAHYTTEANIRKVIEPLFLDDLFAEFDRARGRAGTARVRELGALHAKLAGLRMLDPACGCGNFLVVAYRELRDLEMRILQELGRDTLFEGGGDRYAAASRLNVDQFYGIELEEFPALIAETALWMTDHIANQKLAANRIDIEKRIPLTTAPNIRNADALEIDWADVLPPGECSYVLGNPPFAGKKEQTATQKAQVHRIYYDIEQAADIDYVSCWIRLACNYVTFNSHIRVGFVCTNSVTQGEQVVPIWTPFLARGFGIRFAHRTFEWSSDAKGSAHVHVVVIGFQTEVSIEARRLFDYATVKSQPHELVARNINPYLVDAKNILVAKARKPITNRPLINKDSEATDFGLLTFTANDKQRAIDLEEYDPSWFRPFWGGEEFINDEPRFCLWLINANPSVVRRCKPLVKRLMSLRKLRAKSTKEATQSKAAQPALFGEYRQPAAEYLLIPKVSSQKRDYIPMRFVSPDTIVSGSAQFVETSDKFLLGLLSSAIHMSWMRSVGGRTKSDYQYTVTLVYNTFPWPEDVTLAAQARVAALADAVLAERKKWPTSNLADLYDPNSMPAGLRAAHAKLDTAVDRLYRAQPFASERERVEHLFGRYERLVNPASAAPRLNRRTERRAKAVGDDV